MSNMEVNVIQNYFNEARMNYARRYRYDKIDHLLNAYNRKYKVITYDGYRGFIKNVLSGELFNFKVLIDRFSYELSYFLNDILIEDKDLIDSIGDALQDFRDEYDAERKQIWALYKIIKNLKKFNRYTARLYNLVKYNKSWQYNYTNKNYSPLYASEA